MEPQKLIKLPSEPQEGMIHEGLTVRTIYNKSWKLVECFMEFNGMCEGQCLLYYPDRNVKQESFYHQGLLEGDCTSYSPEGVVLAKSHYKAGVLEGACIWYYPSGSVYSRQNYKKGLWDGLQEYFYEDGTLKTRLIYEEGRLVPPAVILTPHGKPHVRELRWKKDS